ncbi:ABC transporter ATP-binding protein [Marinigracilibium pacificum]|uniref:ABC transporter ATP-binding protein n=1 Tax=Marinigracilibium pacificum TaxID=2729599 RepID=A0A848J2J3_9BACT|nr:ATP-binding cassette domain-containing protein [Marinigracilibium pacificum]NMM48704.1 ABC transporter ATP-binding protein [Marinigracilibium pacificum]
MKPVVEAKNITKRYENHLALDDISLEINKGKIFGLLGPNGAGKTTFIRILTNIIAADSGQIFINGEGLTSKSIEKIGYMPEERGLYKKMKVGDQLMYLAGLKGMKNAEAKESIMSWMKRFEMKGWWKKTVQDLSKGMQQKVQFISTVVHNPDLIILDEPFSGFDPVNANLVRDEIIRMKNEGKTIILSTHRMESVEELCDEIALINKSKLILYGEKNDVKMKFKQNVWALGHSPGDLVLSTGEVVNITRSNGMQVSEIKLSGNFNSNDLIREVVEQQQIMFFHEKLPSINEIFIQSVSEPNE